MSNKNNKNKKFYLSIPRSDYFLIPFRIGNMQITRIIMKIDINKTILKQHVTFMKKKVAQAIGM